MVNCHNFNYKLLIKYNKCIGYNLSPIIVKKKLIFQRLKLTEPWKLLFIIKIILLPHKWFSFEMLK